MLVAIAPMDRPVTKVSTWARVIRPQLPQSPIWPATQPMRKNKITPKMVKMQGRNTPKKVPNPGLLA